MYDFCLHEFVIALNALAHTGCSSLTGHMLFSKCILECIGCSHMHHFIAHGL